MLRLIPRTAVSKKSFKLNRHSIITKQRITIGLLGFSFFVFFFPKSEILIPNNTIEYANYLHIKSTPRKTKSMAQTLYKSTGPGSEGPKPHFCQLDFLALKGARGQAYNGDDTEMIYPKSMQIKFFG